MERVEFRNSRGLKLVGNYHSSGTDAAIILAHGFTSDRSALGRFDSLAKALCTTGYNVLAFDFSGCGESDPEILAAHNMVDDLQSAVAFVKANGCRRIAFYGHSLGGLICLRCATPEIVTMVLSGAPTDAMDYDWKEYYSESQLKEMREKGFFKTIDRTGKERRIGLQMLRDFEEINQEGLLKNVACPVLLIHGNDPADKEELQLLERSQRGIPFLPPGSRIEVIPGANHTFLNHWNTVTSTTSHWYLHHMPIV